MFTTAFGHGVATPGDHAPLVRWLRFLREELGVPEGSLIFAKLQSRLALHLSGGVMENAGILLDRFGYPYIPGSGVKGIARHAAIYALREWAVVGGGKKPEDKSEPASAICAPFGTPVELATAIYTVFGWVDLDWKKDKSDIASALGGDWAAQAPEIGALLAQAIPGITLNKNGVPMENYRGSIAFLDAKPVHEPEVASYPSNGNDLALDVVTPHHPKYYSGELTTATDTEGPIPVPFPTVAEGVLFVFAVRGNGRQDVTSTDHARTFLRVGLETFGAGAKTAAGYGWFADWTRHRKAKIEAVQDEKAREAKAAEEAADKKRRDEDAKRLAAEFSKLAPQEQADHYIAHLAKERQAADRIRKWDNLKPMVHHGATIPVEEQHKALVRWLANTEEGQRLWREEVRDGKNYTKVVSKIHAVKKQISVKLP